MMKTLFALLGFVIAGGVLIWYTLPTYDNVKALQVQIAEYDQALQKAAELQELKQRLLSTFNAFDPADLDRLQKLLPDHVDNVRLILDLDNLAARHGMALQNVVISNPASEGSEKGTPTVIGGNQQKYDSLTLSFSTLGSYQNFLSFLQDLEMSLRIVDLVSLSLAAGSGAVGQSQEPIYNYGITVRTYWLK